MQKLAVETVFNIEGFWPTAIAMTAVTVTAIAKFVEKYRGANYPNILFICDSNNLPVNNIFCICPLGEILSPEESKSLIRWSLKLGN